MIHLEGNLFVLWFNGLIRCILGLRYHVEYQCIIICRNSQECVCMCMCLVNWKGILSFSLRFMLFYGICNLYFQSQYLDIYFICACCVIFVSSMMFTLKVKSNCYSTFYMWFHYFIRNTIFLYSLCFVIYPIIIVSTIINV